MEAPAPAVLRPRLPRRRAGSILLPPLLVDRRRPRRPRPQRRGPTPQRRSASSTPEARLRRPVAPRPPRRRVLRVAPTWLGGRSGRSGARAVRAGVRLGPTDRATGLGASPA